MTDSINHTGGANAPANAQTNAMWGGRFQGGPAAVMQAINNSLQIDKRLALHDLTGSRAHAQMLGACHIISRDDAELILDGLAQIEQEIIKGSFPYRNEFEDIHMNIEARLSELIGTPAGRLHTARSRNDQVATAFRLWLRDAVDTCVAQLQTLQTVLLDQAEEHSETVLPGLTHFQPAQPISFAFHLLAYVEMLGRDVGRLLACQTRLNQSPLGAAALAGTSFPIDRYKTAKALGFAAPATNALDAVSARDFVIEFLSALSISGTHLSRLAEELIVWTAPAFQFVKLPDQLTTGSSIMPQKRNPDAAELVRGMVGRLNGALVQMLTVMKGLPLAYNKDMQEDKACVFHAFESFLLMVEAMRAMIAQLQVNSAAMRAACDAGFLTATDLADWLVQKLNLPFRQAHHVTGQIVAAAEAAHCQLHQLPLAALQAICRDITDDVYKILDIDAALNSRTSFGGTAPKTVMAAIKEARKHYL